MKGKQNYSPLHYAAYRGRLHQVKNLVEKGGMNINEKCNSKQESPLFISCLKGHLDVAEYLIKKGAKLDAMNHSGLSPLYIAACEGHSEVVKLLIENDADVEAVLVKAVQTGNFQLVQYLIVNKIVGVITSNALFKAIQKGHLEIIAYLVEQGAEINVQTIGSTPLIVAIRNNNVDVVKLLLNRGADPNLVPLQDASTPLTEAVTVNNTEIVKYLIKYNTDVDNSDGRLLHRSFRKGNLDIFKMLVLNNPNIEKIKPTLLKISKTFKNTRFSEFINQFQVYNWNIFEVVPRNIKNFVTHILSTNILNRSDMDGNTLLHLAVLYNRLEVAELLLDADADPNVVNEVGNTPLIIAIRAENDRIVALLLKYNVDVNLSVYSYTPLFEAIQNEHFDIFKMLVEKGAHLNEGFPHINDLIDEVVESGQFEKIKFLIEEGNEVSESDCS